jgi:tetratricopeptide (TPR) repeat protein
MPALHYVLFFSTGLQIAAQKNCTCPELQQFNEENNHLFSQKISDGKILTLSASANNICRAKAFELTAGNFIRGKRFDSAAYFLERADSIYKGSGCGDEIYISFNAKYYQLYFDQAKYKEALEYLFKTLPITEKANNTYEYAFCLLDLARVFCLMDQANRGAAYCRISIPEIEKVKDPYAKANLCYNLANRYIIFSNEEAQMSGMDTAKKYAAEAIELGKRSGNLNAVNNGFYQLGSIAYYRKNFQEAIRFTDSSLRISKILDDHNMIAGNYFDMADDFLELGNLKEARRLADSSLFYNKLYQQPEFIAEAYSLIADIAEKDHNYKDVADALRREKNINDSIHTAENTKAITELEQKYNKAKNESRIKDLSRQKQVYFLLAVTGFFLLVAFGFFLRFQDSKNKQKILETEQRLNRSRMNPHFFFNALSSLQAFALQENDGKALASNLSKFSHIMRETLESSYKDYVTIEQEVDFLNEYLELQKMRFPQKFTYEIVISPGIEPDELLIPSMILQPFTENSIEHGFTGIDYAGHISISFDKKENDLLICITDNGKGLATTPKENGGHISRASQIIKDRIFLLNVKLKTRAGFSIDNNMNEKGVTVIIKLPVLFRQDIKA